MRFVLLVCSLFSIVHLFGQVAENPSSSYFKLTSSISYGVSVPFGTYNAEYSYSADRSAEPLGFAEAGRSFEVSLLSPIGNRNVSFLISYLNFINGIEEDALANWIENLSTSNDHTYDVAEISPWHHRAVVMGAMKSIKVSSFYIDLGGAIGIMSSKIPQIKVDCSGGFNCTPGDYTTDSKLRSTGFIINPRVHFRKDIWNNWQLGLNMQFIASESFDQGSQFYFPGSGQPIESRILSFNMMGSVSYMLH